jgi:adenosylmethionine-8-amino-7-oxononanoate aminotransferase
MHPIAKKDHQHIWHPFTQMQDWCKEEPIVIMSGKGAELEDQHGRRYLDANASIWTNLHGHGHPRINRAIRQQLGKIAHSSALGLANEPASLLAEQLVRNANPAKLFRKTSSSWKQSKLNKVFYSDDGATAMEAAFKLAYEHARRSGRSRKPKFLSIDHAYHGDTIGAVSVGQVDLFHRSFAGLLFPTDKVMSPYCYRCPFNRAKPDRVEARQQRKCQWECIGKIEKRFEAIQKKNRAYAGFVFEPVIQGVAGMIVQPKGWLERAATIARQARTPLIADEVMTGFGRTGSLFASHQENVQPDFLCLAKGMTGGYLPMAATLTTQVVYDSFLGPYDSYKSFFHGHSYTGNQLGAAASVASLALLKAPGAAVLRKGLACDFKEALGGLWESPFVGDVRHTGLVAGVELVRDWKTRLPWDLKKQVGIRVCREMADRGVLTRSIGNLIVLMPPYCCSTRQVRKMVDVLKQSIDAVLGKQRI